MKRIILIIFAFVLNSSNIYSFPDVKKYPHDIVDVSGSSAASIRSDNYFQMSKTKYLGFDGYTGYCKLTKYRVSINGEDESSQCTISLPGDDDENSFFTMEIDLGNGFKARYFYFEGGRLVFVSGNNQHCAGWQSWIKKSSGKAS